MNILDGDTAAGSFRQAFNMPNSDEILVFRDVLSCGQLQNFSNFKDWIHFREHFWKNIIEQDFAYPTSFSDRPNDFHADFEEIETSNEIKLWIGCALSDQLVLVFLVFLLDRFNVSFDKLSIYQFTTLNRKNNLVHGLGELNPNEIKQHPEPSKVNDSQIKECLTTWAAITSKSPDDYMSLINSEKTYLPALKRSLKALFFRYPKTSNGLTHWDETILKNARDYGPVAARIIGHTMAEGWGEGTPPGLDTVGDVYLFHRLKTLARRSLTKPLLKLNSPDLTLRETEVEITRYGSETLQNKHNVVSINGINDWVGGVHLDSSSGHTWFREGQELKLKNISLE